LLHFYFNFKLFKQHFLDPDDKRILPLEISDKYVKDKNYFMKLANSLTDETANHLLTYLYYYDAIDLTNKNNIPISKIKNEIIDNSLSSGCIFVKNIENGDMDIKVLIKKYNLKFSPNIQIVNKNDSDYINNTDLYNLYKWWCKETGRYNLNDSNFGKACKWTIKRFKILGEQHNFKILPKIDLSTQSDIINDNDFLTKQTPIYPLGDF